MATTTAWAGPFVGLGDMSKNLSLPLLGVVNWGGRSWNQFSLSPFMSSLWHLDRPYMSLYLLPAFVFSLYGAKYSVGYFATYGYNGLPLSPCIQWGIRGVN